MKKIFLTLFLAGLAAVSMAQAKLELGLKGGVNMASLRGDAVDGSNVTAFHGGAYGLIKITKIGIQPEAIFSKRGSDAVDLNYLDVPIMLKMYLAGGLNVQAGPQFGILLDDNLKDPDGNRIGVKNSDISAALGVGWDLPFGLNITGRYLLGLSQVNETGPSIKGSTYQFSLGYNLFKVGK